MAYPAASQICYGPTLDNLIDVDFPLAFDQLKTWRRPRPGSEHVRYPAAVDSWITGRDFMLMTQLRWIDQSRWSPGGLGVQGFLDQCGEGQPFRLIPDKNFPNFYIDNCFLDDPFDDPQPDLEQATTADSITVTIRNSLVDLAQAFRGVMYEYLPGTSLTDPVAATYNGRGSPGTYVGRDGRLYPWSVGAASGTLRDVHYEGANRGTLLEHSTTNLLLWSEDFGNAVWTTPAPTTMTINQRVGPTQSGAPADLITFNSTSGSNLVSQTATFANPANQIFVFSCWIADGSITWNGGGFMFQVRRGDTTQAQFFTKGANTLKVAETITLQPQANENNAPITWRRVYCTYVCDATTNANVQVLIRSNSVTGTYYVWGAMLENRANGDGDSPPSSYISTTSATVTRGADVLTYPFTYVPQAMTVYNKFTEKGMAYINDAFTWSIGGENNPQFNVIHHLSGNGYILRHVSPGGTVDTSTGSALTRPNYGDIVEHLAIFYADGSVELRQSINGGAEQTSGRSSALTVFNGWQNNIVSMGHAGSGSFPGALVVHNLKIWVGNSINTVALARIS